MAQIEHLVHLIFEDIGNELSVCQSLGYEDYSRLVAGDSRTPNSFDNNLCDIFESAPLDQFHRLVFPKNINIDHTVVEIHPPKKQKYWTQPVSLKIHYACWRFDEQSWIAYAPAIGIKISSKSESAIKEKLAEQCQATLAQVDHQSSLKSLLSLNERTSIQLVSKKIQLILTTQRERLREEERTGDQTPTLDKVASNLNRQTLPEAYLVSKEVRKLAKLLRDSEKYSVLLVGPSGVGKTAIAYQLVRERAGYQVGQITFWETSGSKLIAGMSGFGQWQERCESLVDELAQNESILLVGNLFELSEVGRGGGNRQGIASFLRSYIQRGRLQVVAECTPEQHSMLEQSDPQLLDGYTVCNIEKPSQSQTLNILENIAEHHGRQLNIKTEATAISAIDRLHRRYAMYSAQPQRSIQFLKNLIDSCEREMQIEESHVVQRFSDETGLPRFMITDDQALDLAATRQQFEGRIIQQSEPVELVVDLLAAVKAGLTTPERPIASLMLIGPTGVGKTEMAKALAEFMYGDAQKMLRFDMSEYNHPASIQRLIGGPGYGKGILTSRVRQHPFHVVLFDEIEKADPAFFDLLLQILGEGRLTDGRGQLADFTSSIVLMTSNLGAESFRSNAFGFQSDQKTDHYREHFLNEVRRFVRPELFNRIDRIVPFAPLAEEAVRAIASRELGLIREREGMLGKNVQFTINEDTLAAIAQRGFDPQLGARPLKRYLEEHLVAPLAHQLNASQAPRLIASAELQGDELNLVVKGQTEKSSDGRSAAAVRLALDQLSDQRRRIQALDQAETTIKLKNDIFRQEHYLGRWVRKLKKASEAEQIKLYEMEIKLLETKLVPLKRICDELARQTQTIVYTERSWIEKHYRKEPMDARPIEVDCQNAKKTIDELMVAILLSDSEGSDSVTIVLFSKHLDAIEKLTSAYEKLTKAGGGTLRYFRLCRKSSESEKANFRLLEQQDDNDNPRRGVDAFRMPSAEAVFSDPPVTMVGVGLEIATHAAFPIFSHERGNHIFRAKSDKQVVLVETSGNLLIKYDIPRQILDRLGPFDWASTRRIYDEENATIFDQLLEKQISTNGHLVNDIAHAVDQAFTQHLEKMIDLWK